MAEKKVIDLFRAAMSTSKKIICKYSQYDGDEYAQDYILSPYGLVCYKNFYYVVGRSDSHIETATLCIENIISVSLTEESATPRPDGFDMNFYIEKVMQLCDASMCGIGSRIVGRFGDDL